MLRIVLKINIFLTLVMLNYLSYFRKKLFMLQVLLIGNGFDLAHEAPTSFKDFSIYLIEDVFGKMFKPNLDELRQNFGNTLFTRSKDIFNTSTNYYYLEELVQLDENLRLEIIKNNWLVIYPHLKNKLLLKLYEEQTENWFDIESTYFRHLVSLKNKLSNSNRLEDRNRILKALLQLNRDFNQIEYYLKRYLSSLNIKPKKEILNFLKKVGRGNGILADNIFVIDFNYTQTILNYDIFYDKDLEYVPIHGTLDTDIIFGYGNDKDQEYQDIKNLGVDEFLQNFKTQKYLLKRSYQFILEKLLTKSIQFQIHIIGHSLGMTDKTLLKEIFDSENCQSIHIYKRSDLIIDDIEDDSKQTGVINAFTRLTMAATRIIDDELARQKIKNYEEADYFPLINYKR